MNDRAADASPLQPYHYAHFPRPPRPLGFLVWIVIYKTVKVLLSLAGGILALRLMHHHDLAGDATRLIQQFGLNPEGRICYKIVAQIAGIDPNKLGWVTGVLFFYALLYTIEGMGLYLEKRWAEWFTVFQTSIIIPFEIYSMFHHFHVVTFVIFGSSITTIVYLLWRIQHDRKIERSLPGGFPVGQTLPMDSNVAVERPARLP